MDVSRRYALRIGIAATAALVALPGAGEARQLSQKQAITPVEDDSSWVRRDLLEGCLGESFTLRTRTGSITLKLVSVDDPPNARRDGTVGDEHNFVAVFRGPSYTKLKQGTYPVDSRQLGAFDLFLVPGLTTASGTVYTATFNRLS
jgi:hypothetical protein